MALPQRQGDRPPCAEARDVRLLLPQSGDDLGHVVGVEIVVEVAGDDRIRASEAAQVDRHAAAHVLEAAQLVEPHRVVGHVRVQEDGERAGAAFAVVEIGAADAEIGQRVFLLAVFHTAERRSRETL